MRTRLATPADHDAVWAILEPMIREGATYPLPQDMSRAEALAYWFQPAHEVFVVVEEDLTYKVYLRCSSISMMAAWLPQR